MTDPIKLFQFFQKCHKIFGILPPCQPNQNQKQKQLSINSIETIFSIGFAQFMLTIAAFMVFEAKSIFEYGFAFYVFICATNGFVMYLMFIWQSKNTSTFIGNCEGFIEKRAHSTVAQKQLIDKIELFNKCLSVALIISDTLQFITVAAFSFVKYFIFNSGEDSFFLFLPVWFPFNWRTPVGYLAAWLGQCAGVIVVASIYVQFVNLVFGSCWLFVFIAEDIAQDVSEFNVIAKTTTSNKNHTELTKHFRYMVQIYLDSKQCVKEFNQIIEYSLFAFFAWNMLAISSVLVTLQFQLWADDSNLYKIISLFFVLFWPIMFIFLICEPGAKMTNQFIVFSEKLSGCDWYLLPIGLQRCYKIFLSNTQIPIKMLSYANITCERETSKTIISKAFSYFMTIRKFKP